MAEVRQNLVGNSIGVVGNSIGEQGNLLAGTVAEVGNTIIEHRRGGGPKE